jgi:uridine phosphorylase
MRTLYMKAEHTDIAPYVIFSGDPWRVEVLVKYLENPKKIAFSREYNTYTGTYKGIDITVTSTGIGSPSAAIAMEEMYACGMQVALRMGTVMSLDDDLLDQFIVPIASLRQEKTTDTYVDAAYPAVADIELVDVINQVIREHGRTVSNGLNATLDGFYSQMHESKLSRKRKTDITKNLDRYKQMGVKGIDMESSTLLVLGRLMNVQTAVLTLVTVLENLKVTLEGTRREESEALLCKIALESIHRFALQKGATK